MAVDSKAYTMRLDGVSWLEARYQQDDSRWRITILNDDGMQMGGEKYAGSKRSAQRLAMKTLREQYVKLKAFGWGFNR